jgi:predicted nucleic acid-binding protein
MIIVGTDKDARMLREHEQVLPEYSAGEEAWEQACELAHRCRRAGKTAPFADILIAACARHHKVEVARDDAHFDFLMVI